MEAIFNIVYPRTVVKRPGTGFLRCQDLHLPPSGGMRYNGDTRVTIYQEVLIMKYRRLSAILIALALFLSVTAEAADLTHTVVRGDTMWKLAVKYQVGTGEIIAANPQITNPNLIYPGQTLYIPQTDSAVRAYETEVIRLVNEIRRSYGLSALAENWELSRVARFKSQDLKDRGYFSHTSPTYGTPFQMMTAFGLRYRTAGENIAYGYRTPQAVVDGWMNSSGHRANILNSSFTQIGVGYVSQGSYWTQMFIG